MIKGRLTRPEACWAAAVELTRAESRRTSERQMARNGGRTHRIITHHRAVGKNQPPTEGPTVRLTITE